MVQGDVEDLEVKTQFFAIGLLLAASLPLQCQNLTPSREYRAQWRCMGHVWIFNSDLYCLDANSRQISKTTASGRLVFSSLPSPSGIALTSPYGRSPNTVGLSVDPDGQIYAVDGLQVHVYSADGKFVRSMKPGINLGQGVAALDSEHVYVAGRAAHNSSLPANATVFEIGSRGVERSFSDIFFADRSRSDDMVLNKESHLALDRQRGLLYQLPQARYEIRVFTLDGEFVRAILPPPQFAIKTPEVSHPMGPKSAALEPSDMLFNIVVTGDGGLAVQGDLLRSAKRNGNNLITQYDRFVDLYDPSGNFKRRLTGNDLTSGGAWLIGLDRITGSAFLTSNNTVIESALQ